MPATNDSGTHTTTTSMDLVKSVTSAKNVVFGLDVNAMADGDIFAIQVQFKGRSAGTLRKRETFYVGPVKPASLVVETPPYASPVQIDFSVQKISGTNRTFDWWVTEM